MQQVEPVPRFKFHNKSEHKAGQFGRWVSGKNPHFQPQTTGLEGNSQEEKFN
jgi:hypothetical protein